MKPEYGRCHGTIRTAIIVNGARGRKYIRVFLRGGGKDPAIILPEDVARLNYDRARKPASRNLYAGQDFRMEHARVLCKWLQGRDCTVRVTHQEFSLGGKHSWDYQIWEVK